jgi:hypothetical protein
VQETLELVMAELEMLQGIVEGRRKREDGVVKPLLTPSPYRQVQTIDEQYGRRPDTYLRSPPTASSAF